MTTADKLRALAFMPGQIKVPSPDDEYADYIDGYVSGYSECNARLKAAILAAADCIEKVNGMRDCKDWLEYDDGGNEVAAEYDRALANLEEVLKDE